MTDIVADTDLRAWLPRRRLNIEDGVTNTVTTLFTLEHTSTGTVAANFGLRLLATLEDASGNTPENAGALDFIWADATGASEDCDLVISLKTAGAALAERHRFSSTGVYTATGGINLSGTNLIGVRDIYGDGSGNHNIYANAAVTDATERSLTLNVLNATGDAWLAMITLTPAAAAPTMDFNSRPISNLTLGGTVTGGNQTVNALGHIGIGNSASSTTYAATYSPTLDAIAAFRAGWYSQITLTGNPGNFSAAGSDSNVIVSIDAASSGNYSGMVAQAYNTTASNLTNTIGLSGFRARGYKAGGAGVVTGAACFYAEIWGNNVAAGTLSNAYGLYITTPDVTGTVTNAYGIYIANVTGAGTLNYAIYSVGGLVYFGGNVNTQGVFTVAGTQVVGARVVDARCDDVINSGDVTTDGVIDSLRDAMITHGLIAAA